MLKKHFLIFLSFALIVHVYFSFQYPLTRDELNIWNMFAAYPDYPGFWQHFIKYESQAPLFYVLWFPFFKSNLYVFLFRLPSLMAYLGTLFVWNKLFPYSKEENNIPWIMILFTPFIVMYSSFFQPYSMLIFFSVLNFYLAGYVEQKLDIKSVMLFSMSCLLLTLTHYFGALQVLLLVTWAIAKLKNNKIKYLIVASAAVCGSIFLFATDFLNDIIQVHEYQKTPGFLKVAGDINLLIGGKFVALILITLICINRKKVVLKNIHLVYILLVLLITLLKSIILSPTFEARYLLITIYPIFKMTQNLNYKKAYILIAVTCLISLKILADSYGPGFVIDYRKVKMDEIVTGIIAGPCPKYYLWDTNYICKGHLSDKKLMLSAVDRMYVDDYNLQFYLATVPEATCKPIIKGLNDCTVPPGYKF